MSCSSSDDENLELLKEAQDSQFLNDCMFTGEQKKLNSESENKAPESLRKSTNDEDYNPFKVTPQFREHVAKHLSALLEKKLKRILEYEHSDEIAKKRQKNGGIKLFSESDKYLKLNSKTVDELPLPRRRYTSTGQKVEKDSLKQITVTGDYILSKKGTEHWSKRTKACVYQYKKLASGQLELVE